MMRIDDRTLEVVADLTLRLTELRLSEGQGLPIEEFAPQVFQGLLKACGSTAEDAPTVLLVGATKGDLMSWLHR